jgi:multidrug efflux system outer membrane protein
MTKPSPRLTVLALAAALLTGCSFIPKYERPAAPVAAQFPDAGTAPAQGAQSVAELPWQDFVRDARLRQLVELALANNRDLRVAALNIDKARAQYQIQRADRLPTVGLGASGSRSPQPGGNNLTVYQAGLAMSSWELDFFGRVASLSEAALAQYLATEEGRKATQISLVASVTNAYLSLLADDELLALTRQTLATREESIQLSKLRLDAGVASELDYRQAQSLLEAARATLAQVQRQRALDANLLSLLVGQPDWQQQLAASPPSTSLESAVVTSELAAGLPSEVLVTRPDIRAAEQQLVSANANIGAARAAFFPQITLTAGFGTVSSQLSGLFEGGSWGFSVAPQLLLPIFDAGRNQARLDTAQVSREIAVAQYEQAIQTAFREVADALAGRTTLSEQLRAQQAQAEAESARFKLSDLRYRNGVASYLDLLDAQRSLFATQQAVVQTRLAQLQNQVALYKALGGGWTQQP